MSLPLHKDDRDPKPGKKPGKPARPRRVVEISRPAALMYAFVIIFLLVMLWSILVIP